MSGQTPWFDVLAGVRYEYNSHFFGSFVPRVAIMKSWDDFHGKLLFAGGFHSPGIENINSNINIKPERTTTFELELGYKAFSRLFLTGNLFLIQLYDPIVFTYNGSETYLNFSKSGSAGVELEARWLDTWGSATFSHSFYVSQGNEVSFYRVDDDSSLHLGFPSHKTTLSGNFYIFPFLNLGVSNIFFSNTYGYGLNDANQFVQKKFNPILLTHLFFQFEKFGVQGLSFGIGVKNLFNSEFDLLQPYSGGHAPLPTLTREFFIKAQYGVTF